MASQKKKTWTACSKYIRLRDSIDYCKKHGLFLNEGIVQCCTCPKIKQWKYVDAGHFISRGSGGMSGVYFDERNIHAQCKPCNGFHQGNAQSYGEFMLQKYGQDVVDQLRVLDKVNSYRFKLQGLEIYYKEAYKELKAEI